jgi:hypothetical protein
VDLFARVKSLVHGRRWLAVMAVVLGAGTFVFGPAVAPASAASAAAQFSPVWGGTVTFEDYNTRFCLLGNSGNFSAVNTFFCTGGSVFIWNLYSTPFGGWNIVNEGTGQCLDSNAAGSDYTDSCNWNNEYQSWTFGGEGPGETVQDQVTQRCLDSNGVGQSYTSPCDWNDWYQNWILLEEG